MKTAFEARNWSYLLQHDALWGKQELSLSGLYAAPPSLHIGNQTLKGERASERASERVWGLQKFIRAHQSAFLFHLIHGVLSSSYRLGITARCDRRCPRLKTTDPVLSP